MYVGISRDSYVLALLSMDTRWAYCPTFMNPNTQELLPLRRNLHEDLSGEGYLNVQSFVKRRRPQMSMVP